MPLFGPSIILREEEESPEDFRYSAAPTPAFSPAPSKPPAPAAPASQPQSSTPTSAAPAENPSYNGLARLLEERNQILANDKFSPKEKLVLLENNRVTLLTLRGGRISRSDEVIKWVLIFAAFTTLLLAALNVFAALPTEVTLSFIGTVLGGTIATIVQKLGRV